MNKFELIKKRSHDLENLKENMNVFPLDSQIYIHILISCLELEINDLKKIEE